jgi:hypothetical protein
MPSANDEPTQGETKPSRAQAWVDEQLADLAHRPGGILTHTLTALWDGLAAQWQDWKLDPAPNRVRLRRFMDRTQSVVYALLVVNVGWGTHDNYLHDRPFDR